MVASGARDPNRRKGSQENISHSFKPHKLYRHLFPVLFRLAVDVDSVSKHLFAPLTKQLIHWITSSQKETLEITVLLETLTTALSNSTDGALREFAAECMGEFFKWSVKQGSQSGALSNVRELLRRLYSLARHPDPYRRLGVALSFNNIYRLFRNENILISAHLLNVVYNLLISLSLAEKDDFTLGTREEIMRALVNLQRIVTDPGPKKYRHLVKRHQDREGPECCASLDDFTTWLFGNVGRREESFRRMCQNLFEGFAPLTTRAETARDWVVQYIQEQSLSQTIQILEPDQRQHHVLDEWIKSLHRRNSILAQYEGLLDWLEGFGACLDCYFWILNLDYLHPSVLWASSEDWSSSDTPISSVLLSVRGFLAQANDSKAVKQWTERLIPHQYELYQKHNCTLLIRIFRLVGLLLSKYPEFEVVHELMDTNFYKAVFQTLLTPTKKGFIMADTTRIQQLQKTLGSVCYHILSLPTPHRNRALEILRLCLQDRDVAPPRFEVHFLAANVGFFTYLFNGYKQLWSSRLLVEVLGTGECKAFADRLGQETFLLSHHYSRIGFANARKRINEGDGQSSKASNSGDRSVARRTLSPLHRHVGRQMLDLALHLGINEKILFGFIQDDTRVGDESNKVDTQDNKQTSLDKVARTTKGEEFYNNFRVLIDSFLMTRFNLFVTPLCRTMFSKKDMFKVMLNMADHAIRMRQRKGTLYLDADHPFRTVRSEEFRKELDSAENFISILLNSIGPAYQWWSERNHRSAATMTFDIDQQNIAMTLELIQRVVVLDDRQLLDPTNKSFAFLTKLFFQCLAEDAPFPLKEMALNCIMPFLTSAEPIRSQAMQAVKTMTCNPPFPVKSTVMDEKSMEWYQYSQLLSLVLRSLVESGSIHYFKILLGILRERQHKHLAIISQACQQFVEKINQPGKSEKILDACTFCAGIVLDRDLDTDPVDNARRFTLEFVLVPLLKVAPKVVVKRFFDKYGSSFSERVESKPNGPEKMSSMEEQQLELLELSGAYQLLTVLFSRLEHVEINETGVKHKPLMKIAHDHIRKCGPEVDDSLYQELLDFRRVAYGCLAAACCRTQKDAKFFDMLLFKENPTRADYLWEQLIDTQSKLVFEIATNFKVIEAQLLTAINVRFLASRRETRRPFRYLPSQYYADSSLSPDIEKMRHYLEPESRTDSLAEEGLDHGTAEYGADHDEELTPDADLSAGEAFDLDPMNTNPCMATILNVIDHMFRTFGRSWSSDLPQFMAFLRSKLSDPGTHINVKMFITKIIINRWVLFERYASYWFQPLAMFMLQTDNGGIGFHYMLRDVCYLFLQWTSFVPADTSADRLLTSRFLQLVFKVSSDFGSEDAEIWLKIRSNLRLVKLLVEKWKDRVDISKIIIIDKLKAQVDYQQSRTGGKGKYDRHVGLQLMGICLANGFAAFNFEKESVQVQDDLILALLDNVKQRRKDIYQPASEVFGMVLKSLYSSSDAGSHWLAIKEKAEKLFRESIKELFQRQEWEKMLLVLVKVVLHVPQSQLLDASIMNLVLSLPLKLPGSLMHHMLQLVFWTANKLERVFLKIRDHLKRVLKDNKSPKAQEIGLMVIHRILSREEPVERLGARELREIVALLAVTFTENHPSETCRGLYYKVLMYIHDSHPVFSAEKSSDPRSSLVMSIQSALLRGLSDPAPAVSAALFKFWGHGTRLPTELTERLLSCLTTLYQPEAEEDWLRYSVFLLLQPLSQSTDYNRPFSDTPLVDCKFEDLAIDSQGSSHSMPFTPLFSAGLQDPSGLEQEIVEGKENETDLAPLHRKRTIASAEFSLSQQTAKLMSMDASQLYDSNIESQLSETKYIMFRDTQQISSQFPASGSLAEFNLAAKNKHKLKKLKSSRGKSRGGTKRVTMNDIIQRRFYKRQPAEFQEKSSGILSKIRELDFTKRYSKIWQARSKEQAAQTVTLFRKYRTGDLPDIQIHHRELLLPLQALHCDPDVSKSLFIMIFKAVYLNLDKLHPPPEPDLFREKIQRAIGHLLSARSPNCSASFISCLHQVTVECSKVDPNFTDLICEDGVSMIGQTAFESKNYHSGILLLEQIFNNPLTNMDGPHPKRRRADVAYVDVSGTADRRHEEVWLQLARLYHQLGEKDIVLGLYKSHAKSQFTKEAVLAAIGGDYVAAMDTFERALAHAESGQAWPEGQPPTTKEIDYWEDERLMCRHNLTEWGNLYENVMAEFDGDADRIWDGDEVYLNHYLTSCSKLKNKQKELFGFISRAMENATQRECLENKFPSQLALVYAKHNDITRARYYLQIGRHCFLNEWVQLSPLAKGPRQHLLFSLQQLTEIEEFLLAHPDASQLAASDLMDNKVTGICKERWTAIYDWDVMHRRTSNVLQAWKSRFPSKIDPVNVWDDIITNRTCFLDKLTTSLESRLTDLETKIGKQYPERRAQLALTITDVRKSIINMYIRVSTAMIKAGNHKVAGSYLIRAADAKGSGTESMDLGDNLFWLRFARFDLHFSWITSVREKVRKAEELWKLRDDLLTLDDDLTDQGFEHTDRVEPFLLFKLNRLQAAVHVMIAQMLTENPEFEQFGDRSKPSDLYHDAQELLSESCQVFRRIIKQKQRQGQGSGRLIKKAAKSYMTFARFCLRRMELPADVGRSVDVSEDYVHQYVESVLEAMVLNNREAMAEFPRVLEATAKCPIDGRTRELFMKCTCNETGESAAGPQRTTGNVVVPVWMFIQWIPQLLGVLGQAEGKLIFPILETMAKTYPQALYFPFQLSRESICGQEYVSQQAAGYLSILGELLCMPIIDKFVEALDGLTCPNLKFKDWFALTRPLLTKDRERAVRLYKNFFEEVLSGCRANVGEDIGINNAKFAKTFRPHFIKRFGEDGSKLLTMDDKTFLKYYQEIKPHIDKLQSKPGPVSLKRFSSWLHNFRPSQHHHYIEVPGQYTGRECPQPENHVRIVNFHPHLTIMRSIRRPKALTIHGDDEQDHKYLVKGGEDLRLDQRIEQLFETMNEILLRDTYCADRRLSVRTYQVIPMTTRVGLLEWVPGTIPLKELLERQIEKGSATLHDVMVEYMKFVKNHSGVLDNRALSNASYFLGLYRQPSRLVIQKFAEIETALPAHLLIRAVGALCNTPESFIHVRSKFARSFSAFSICSYILGIGDRHLDNILLDQNDGSLVGIDFGASFGQGLLLPIPELMPFRFTRQFQRLMDPLNMCDLAKQDMKYTLNALRKNQQLLLTIMEVFVKEPQLDWVESARKARIRHRVGKTDHDGDIDDISWYPRKKIDVARKKLNGESPCAIMVDELRDNSELMRSKGSYERVMQVLRGGSCERLDGNSRGLEPCSSVEEQVQRLVDIATDPNILGRTWWGWMPFV